MSNFRKLAWALALLSPAWMSGQETRSSIFGRVLDPQSSVVVGATVLVVNADTNATVQLQTNDTGYYEANLLVPGNYQVTVEAAGFKKAVRGGVSLPLSARVQVNVQLELGLVAETVSVTADAPLLETNAVSSGRTIENRSIADLPVPYNNPLVIMEYTPGLQTDAWRGPAHLAATVAVAGTYTPGNVGGNEVLIDGVYNIGGNRRIAYMPHSDTLQEFKVETSNFDASTGHATGVTVLMMSKVGTNRLHGAVSGQHWEQRWNASPFFVKQAYYRSIAQALASGNQAKADAIRAQPILPSSHSNNYSAVLGGPVVLPKVYDGRNRLFFFFSFNGQNDSRLETNESINRTVPTLANRQGDFSQLLNVDAVRYQIYDPLSVRPDPARPTHYIRNPISGNVIPGSRIVNPAYTSYLKFLPTPNADPIDPRKEPTINYIAGAIPWIFHYYALSNRIDYQQSSRNRFYGRWSWSDFYEDRLDWAYQAVRGLQTSDLIRHNVAATADWVATITPSSVVDTALSVNEYRDGSKFPVAKTFKPSSVGLPAYMDAKAASEPILPEMDFAGYESLGRYYPTLTRYRTISLKSDLFHVRGKHTFRIGYDMRQQFRTGGGGGYTSGQFSFTNAYTRRNDDLLTPAGDLGHSWAAFMMGLPSAMLVDTNDSYASHTPAFSVYGQDGWRLTPRLTLNVGLRVEYEQGLTERYNRMIGPFDPNLKLPISEAAGAAYAKNPLAELAASSFQVQGGSLYPNSGGLGRQIWQNELMWMPRLAVAYQLNPQTVLRSGYGIYYDTMNAMISAPNQFGFSRSTATNLTNDFGVNWLAGDPQNGISPLMDPFPVRADGTRFDQPVRDALDGMAIAGRSFSYKRYDSRHARQQRWRAGVQRQLGANTVVEVAYAGYYSDRVPVSQKMDPLAAQYWADGLQRNNAIASDLNSNVPNPFQLANYASLRASNPAIYQDMSTQGFFTSPTIRKNQLLRAFPQIASLSDQMAPLGAARSHGLEVSFERRFSRGFNLNLNYTGLHARAADYYFNEFDTRPSWRESNYGRPHRFTATSIIELPFGKGRPLLRSGPLNYLLGGFQLGIVYTWQPGPLLDFPNLFYYGNLNDIGTGPRTLDHWFNTDNFQRTSALAPAAFHRRVFPTRVSGVRDDMLNEWSANVQRELRFTERLRMQLRFDALNVFNRSNFRGVTTDPLSTNFGRMLGQPAVGNRNLQLEAKIRF